MPFTLGGILNSWGDIRYSIYIYKCQYTGMVQVRWANFDWGRKCTCAWILTVIIVNEKTEGPSTSPTVLRTELILRPWHHYKVKRLHSLLGTCQGQDLHLRRDFGRHARTECNLVAHLRIASTCMTSWHRRSSSNHTLGCIWWIVNSGST